tara:strand:- start:1246 stop:1638 length:393 start_codon:yes stop_codon:yes gene_type:complete
MRLIDSFCELVLAHNWRASASLLNTSYSVEWIRHAMAEKDRLARIAKHDDECGYLWELAIAVFGGKDGRFGHNAPIEAIYELHEFLDAWNLRGAAATHWRIQSYNALHPTPPIDPSDDNHGCGEWNVWPF